MSDAAGVERPGARMQAARRARSAARRPSAEARGEAPAPRPESVQGCVMCKEPRPLSAFGPLRPPKAGSAQRTRFPDCADCRRKWNRINAQRHPRPTKALRRAVYAACEGHCLYCDRPLPADGPFDLDHVIARTAGGPHAFENLVLACADCNRGELASYGQEIQFLAWPATARDAFVRYVQGYLRGAWIVDGTTFWEKRQRMDAQRRDRRWRERQPWPLVELATVARRIRHLLPTLRAFPVAS